MKSGCSLSSGSVSKRPGCAATSSSHRTSRHSFRGDASSPSLDHTRTCSTLTTSFAARSAIAFIGTGRPRRTVPSAVISTFAPASARRAATASGPNPLKIGTQIAPSLEQAMTAATVSIAIGMKMPTASRLPHPERSQPVRQPVGQLAELPVGDPTDVAVLGLPHDRDGLGGSIGPEVDALMGHVGLPAREPRRPLDAPGRVEDLLVRRQERDPQVTDHGVPEPHDVADGPRHQLVVRLDLVGAHEPGHVRAFHVLGRRGPHDVLHADTV